MTDENYNADVIEEDSSYGYGNSQTEVADGTPTEDKTLLSKIFDTEKAVENFKMSVAGFERQPDGKIVKVRFPIAGDAFISKAAMDLRAVLNEVGLLLDGDDDFVAKMLFEKIFNFIRVLYDEPTVKQKDFMQLYLMYSNPLEQYLGIVENGSAKETLKQIMIGVYKENGNVNNDNEFNPFAIKNIKKGMNIR